MLRDHQLLVRRHDKNGNPAFRPRSERFASCIRRRVKNDAKPSKCLRDAGADGWRIFANAGREHEGVEPAEGSREHPGIEPDAVDEIVDSESRARIGARLEVSHVVADTGQAFKAAVTIKKI